MTKEQQEKFAEIQKTLSVKKGHRNEFGGFNYWTKDDILSSLKDILDGATVILEDKIVLVGDRYYVKSTAIYEDGEFKRSASAYAREELEKKKSDAPQLTGSASTYARKYALAGLFAIADGENDPDESSHRNDSNIPTINYPDDTVPERTVNDVEFSQSLDEDAEKNSYTLYGGTPVCKVDSSHGEMAPSKYGNGHYCKICWKNKAK